MMAMIVGNTYDIYIEILLRREREEARKIFASNIDYSFNILGNNEDFYMVLRNTGPCVITTMSQVNLITK